MILTKRSRKVDVEVMKNELVKLIDESREVTYKEAFYSHPLVEAILEDVNTRWERSGRVGRPIDHATPDEIAKLYKIAKKVVKSASSQ